MLFADTTSHALIGDERVDTGRSSVISCVINLSCTCMGTGMLALPFALSMAGTTAGVILLVFSACICMLSLHMLVSSGRHVGTEDGPVNFASLCCAALGPHAGIGIDVMVLANCLGTATSYLIVAADCFSAAFNLPRGAVVLASLCATLPAAFFRSMDTLKASSSVAICCLLGIVLMVLAFGLGTVPALDPCPRFSSVVHGHCGGHVTPFSSSARSIFCSLPYILMAFTCQQNAFSVFNELRRPTPARQCVVCIAAPLVPLILYLTIALCGYLTFGDRVPSNIINAYPRTSAVSTARCVLGVVVLCNYPLQLFPCRVSALSLMRATCGARDAKAALRASSASYATWAPPKPATELFINEGREVRLTYAFHLATGAIALLVTDLGTVVAVVGSTGSAIVSLVCPALAYAILLRRRNKVDGGQKAGADGTGVGSTLFMSFAALLMLGLGAAVMPSSSFCGV